jgi:hypothetical protein
MSIASGDYVLIYRIVKVGCESYQRIEGVLFREAFFYVLRDGVVCCCKNILFITCLLNTIYVSCKCYWAMLLFHPGFSQPSGTLASRGRVAQTSNGVIRLGAPGLTSSAAPVRTGVRSCGLNSFTFTFSLRKVI